MTDGGGGMWENSDADRIRFYQKAIRPTSHIPHPLCNRRRVREENHSAYCAVRGAFAARRFTNSRAVPGTPLGSWRKKASVV